jgi:hypothetical protein
MLLAAAFISQAGQPTPQQNLGSTLIGNIIIESSLMGLHTVIKQIFTTVLILDPKPPMRNVNMRNEVELRSILTTFCEDNLDVNW